MKKIVLSAIGFAFTLSFLGSSHFSTLALNKGDGGGAPAGPDLVYGDYPVSADGDTPAPAYTHGEGWIADGDHGRVSKQETHADHF